MSLPEGKPRDIEFDARERIIAKLRQNTILRAGDDFKLKRSDLDPNTRSWKILVGLMAAAIGFGLWLVVSQILGYFAFHYTVHNRIVTVIGAILVLVVPGLLAWRAYVTHPWAAWGISTLGSLRSVKGGRIVLLPFLNSPKGILNTREETFYIPVNQGIMRGRPGQSVIRISLNVVVTYAAAKTKKSRIALFLNVTEPDVSLFRVAEGMVTEWMREHPFTALIATASMRQTQRAVHEIVRAQFPNQDDVFSRAFTEQILNVVFTPQDVERLKEIGPSASPGETMKVMLQKNVEKWGISVKSVGLTDIELPPVLAEEFERAEAIGEMLANLVHAHKAEFPDQQPDWYRDKATETLRELIRFGGGQRPHVFTQLGDSEKGPFS